MVARWFLRSFGVEVGCFLRVRYAANNPERCARLPLHRSTSPVGSHVNHRSLLVPKWSIPASFIPVVAINRFVGSIFAWLGSSVRTFWLRYELNLENQYRTNRPLPTLT